MNKLLSNDLIKTDESELLTVKEISEVLGLSIFRIYQLTRLNKIPHIRINNNIIKFEKAEILNWNNLGRPDISKSNSIKYRSVGIGNSCIHVRLKRDQPVIFQIEHMYDLIFKLIDAAIKKDGVKKTMSKIMFHFLKK